jgi:glycosyltransferase involved in cell wall biosynthesis
MSKISAIVITYNEEKNIRRCLESLSWADEIVLVDSYSEDNTKNIAKQFTDRIFDVKWEGFGRKKEFARNKASLEWVLCVDADEVVTSELKDEIKKTLQAQPFYDGFYIPRKSNFLGKWIKHSGWYPDYGLRLFKRHKAKFDVSLVHEKLEVEGKIGYLKNHLLHYTDPDINHYLSKLNHYTSLSAEELYKKGKKATMGDLLFRPPTVFFKMFIWKMGFLDGVYGLILAFFSSFHVFTKYAKLWHLQKDRLEMERL